MDHHHTRLRQEQRAELNQSQSGASPKTRNFSSVEELLRYDATQVQLPTQVEDRLRESLGREPSPEPPWWERWFKTR